MNLRGIIRDLDTYANNHGLPTYTEYPHLWQLVDWWPFPAACNARVFKADGDKHPWALPFRVTGNGVGSYAAPELWEG